MNINCPKCGFNQPEDQYCANCGVDMTKFEPQKKPLWQRVAGNWIFQLSMLLVVVIFLIARDIIFPPQKRVNISQKNLPAVEQKSFRGSENGDPYAATRVQPPPAPAVAKKVAPPPVKKPAATAEKPDRTPKLKPLQMRIGAFAYLASREQIESLASKGEYVDEGVLKISAKHFAGALKTGRSDWKKLKTQGQNFEFNAPRILFFGLPAVDEGKNQGIYARAVVAEGGDPKNLNVEVRTWSELGPKGEAMEGPGVVYSLPRTDVLLLTNVIPHDIRFSPADKKNMEADSVLSALFDPRFTDGIADLVLVIQFK